MYKKLENNFSESYLDNIEKINQLQKPKDSLNC